MKRLTRIKRGKWARYNRWRRNNRALDRKRRLERRAERAAILPASPSWPTVKSGRAPAPLFRVTIRCRDGHQVSFAVTESPWGGLMPSPTAAARKIAALLTHYRPAVIPAFRAA